MGVQRVYAYVHLCSLLLTSNTCAAKRVANGLYSLLIL